MPAVSMCACVNAQWCKRVVSTCASMWGWPQPAQSMCPHTSGLRKKVSHFVELVGVPWKGLDDNSPSIPTGCQEQRLPVELFL
eukprot:364417-Chlamydomonas_euryale.AAC.5